MNFLATSCATSCKRGNEEIDEGKESSLSIRTKEGKKLSRVEKIAAEMNRWTTQNAATLSNEKLIKCRARRRSDQIRTDNGIISI